MSAPWSFSGALFLSGKLWTSTMPELSCRLNSRHCGNGPLAVAMLVLLSAWPPPSFHSHLLSHLQITPTGRAHMLL